MPWPWDRGTREWGFGGMGFGGTGFGVQEVWGGGVKCSPGDLEVGSEGLGGALEGVLRGLGGS